MNVFPNGTAVKINQGFGEFSYGVVVGFTEKKNMLGWPNNYIIRLTGGVHPGGKPVTVGKECTALASNVSAV